MKTFLLGLLSVFSSGCLFANTSILMEEVSFTETLTNDTAWVYNETRFLQSGEMQITKAAAFVESKIFPFAVTRVIVVAKNASQSTSRNLLLVPIFEDGSEGESVDITPQTTEYEERICDWQGEMQVRSFRILSSTGSGNITLSSATISGVKTLRMPENIQVSEIYSDRFSLAWTSDENAISNKLDIYKKVDLPFSADYNFYSDFHELSNDKGNTKDVTEEIKESMPGFEGTALRIPAHTNGVLQIGTTTNPGMLLLPPLESYSKLKLVMNVKYADNDPPRAVVPVKYILDSQTNDLAEVEIINESSYKVVDLDLLPQGAKIAIYSPLHNDKRIMLDSIGFATSTSEAVTRVDKIFSKTTTKNSITFKELEANTTYQFTIVSYADDNAVSRRTPFQSVVTNSEIFPAPGFSVILR